MTDFWKSNDRKYCDFCQCWIADNKPSIQFHESGRRHKLNVQKRLSDISRSSHKAQKEQSKIDADLRKMNDAAMKAYMQDISAGADISSRALAEQQKAEAAAAAAAVLETGDAVAGPSVGARVPNKKVGREADPFYIPGDFSDDEMFPPSKKTAAAIAEAAKQKRLEEISKMGHGSMWVEAVSDEGYTYYWNIKTNKSVWEPPKEGFMKKEEYKKINDIVVQKQEEVLKQEVKYEVENAEEIAAKLKREQMRKLYENNRKVKEEIETMADSKKQRLEEEAILDAAAGPYGRWQEVEHREVKPVDLELPVVPEPLYVPSVAPEVPVRKFKEKIVEYIPADAKSSLNDTFFKKRKVTRNARQRLDDD
ncbi:WW domain-binding protein 4 [Toxorhynchites rutilus septentrionalis]|uniref:WW domain-binding protein 4 n=1 Tax=Toxorhynchites rutilus septentrionalis TaxID=329112 RepID=UPI0024797A03|nr:WW domain-binding protein 4 [Toxorhynchites rutilus septentrionalis]XP_055626567.1 WW domain-binding protein 4 [Toxorhynchites rutilus septentrionalis]